MTWREKSLAVIQPTVAANPEMGRDELRQLISQSYPFQVRRGYAYQCWRETVNRLVPKGVPEDVRLFWVK